MPYTCEVRNIFGTSSTGSHTNGPVWILGTSYARDNLSLDDNYNNNRVTIVDTEDLVRNLSALTGKDVTGTNNSAGIRAVFFYGEDTSTSIEENSETQVTDYGLVINEVTPFRIPYQYTDADGFERSGQYVITPTDEVVLRTVVDIKNFFITAGFTAIGLATDVNQPVIVCTDSEGSDETVSAIVDTSAFPSTNVEVTITDGDPGPFIVSTTEPESGSEGFGWFNPETGKLSVYTEDS